MLRGSNIQDMKMKKLNNKIKSTELILFVFRGVASFSPLLPHRRYFNHQPGEYLLSPGDHTQPVLLADDGVANSQGYQW